MFHVCAQWCFWVTVFFILAVQQKDTPPSTSTSAITLVSNTPASVAVVAASSLGTVASSSPVATDLYIPTASADVAADIAKYTNKVSNFFSLYSAISTVLPIYMILWSTGFQIMDAIKGTMTEIYNDLSKSTSGNTIAEVGPHSQPFRDWILFEW